MSILTVKSLIVATTNKGKVKEIAYKFAPLGVLVQSLADYPNIPPIVEDGSTFMDNAEIKARTVAQALGQPALADDSGLCVDALDGAPGVYSARFAGEHATDALNVEKLLRVLREGGFELDSRTLGSVQLEAGLRILSTASFVCALALVDPSSDQVYRAEGRCSGFIIDQPRGSGGFGYDPIFFVPSFGRTMAELSVEEKQSVSHRGRALTQMMSQFD
jgi:XTP/dITP diphosphohydrolase